MKKSHSFNELSDQACEFPGCETKIKKRLVEKERDFPFCYKCWKIKEWFRRGSK